MVWFDNLTKRDARKLRTWWNANDKHYYFVRKQGKFYQLIQQSMEQNKQITGVYTEQKPDKTKLFEVTVNGYKYFYDKVNRLLYEDTLQGFARMGHLTSNERQQLENEMKYKHNTSIY